MKPISSCLTAIALTVCLFFIFSCKKSPGSPGIPGGTPSGIDTSNIPFFTPPGDAAGAPISGSIGASGGTLKSNDGRIELIVPPGALSQSTNITIQPIVNLCPGGIGLAYNLLPNGTKFSVPASLVYHYTQEEMNGTEPLLVSSVFQDSAGAWEVNDTEKGIDSVNKTIGFDVNHFTPYGFVPQVRVVAAPIELVENQTSLIQIQIWIMPGNPAYSAAKYVRSVSNVSNSAVSNWQINDGQGTPADGTLTGNGSKAVYKAPSVIDQNREVDVSADYTTTLDEKLRGGIIKNIKTLDEGIRLQLNSGVFSYDVSMRCVLHQTSFYIPDVYTDLATMQLDIKYKDATISNVINHPPTAEPSTGKFGSLTVSFANDGIGIINIDEQHSTATVSLDEDVPDNVSVRLVHTQTVYPLWNLQDNNGGHKTQGGFSVTGYPQTFDIPLKNSTQIINIDLGNGTDFIEITATPRH